LRFEVDKLNKNLKIFEVIEDILNCQRPPYDKSGFGYIGKVHAKKMQMPIPARVAKR
jgi:hypothetical protein